MYQQIVNSLSGFQLIVVAIILYYVAATARNTSSVARAKGVPLGLIATAFLATEGWLTSGMELSEFLIVESFRLVFLTFVVVGLTSVVVKYGAELWQTLITRPQEKLKERLLTVQRERERKQQREEQQRLAVIREAEWEAARPERERAEREVAERKRVATERQRLESERRVNARQKLLLCYHQHSPQIQDSISWERFQEYVETYLADSIEADQVELNAERMMDTIAGHFEAAPEVLAYRSLSEIRQQYDAEREEIECGNFDAPTKASLLADVCFREAQAIAEERQ